MNIKNSYATVALTGLMGLSVLSAPMAASASQEGKRNTGYALGAAAAALLLAQHNKLPGLLAAGGAAILLSQANRDHSRRHDDYSRGDYRQESGWDDNYRNDRNNTSHNGAWNDRNNQDDQVGYRNNRNNAGHGGAWNGSNNQNGQVGYRNGQDHSSNTAGDYRNNYGAQGTVQDHQTTQTTGSRNRPNGGSTWNSDNNQSQTSRHGRTGRGG